MSRLVLVSMALGLFGCDPASTADDGTDPSSDPDLDTSASSDLSPAFDAFGDNVTTYLDGDEVVIETNGHPDHATPYWGPGHELYIEPTATTHEQMAPGYIERFQGSYTLRVPADPQLASSPTSTGLGAIGIAVSGAVIYNDEEGPGVPIDNALRSLDFTGAHTGPQSYHYHLETKAWSDDDDALIAIVSDGFFLYGRRCASTGTFPSDLDASNGHSSPTQFHDEERYHYHTSNEEYLGHFILFPGNYQGTPSRVQ